jgi:hypothetical protein
MEMERLPGGQKMKKMDIERLAIGQTFLKDEYGKAARRVKI